MNYELNLTTSRLRRTPPIHCVAGGELGLTHGLNRTTKRTRTTGMTKTTKTTGATRGNGLIANTARCVIMYIYLRINY